MSKPKPNYGAFIVVMCLIGILGAIIHSLPEPPDSGTTILAPPGKPVSPVIVKPVDVRPVPPVLPQPKPRDIASEPTATLLAEWNAWRHSPAKHTREIQLIYEQLLKRQVIRRDGEPASESSGGRRKIGRRR